MMTPGYEAFEMVERHGVGNILRLLWAYALHRGSERLADRARRVLARAGALEASWTEAPAVADGGYRDAGRRDLSVEAAPRFDGAHQRGTKETVPVKAMRGTPRRQDEGWGAFDRGRELSMQPAGTARPAVLSMPSSEREPWFRALQVAHRAAASKEPDQLTGGEGSESPQVGGDFHGVVPDRPTEGDAPLEREAAAALEREAHPHPQGPIVEVVGEEAKPLPDVPGDNGLVLIPEGSGFDHAGSNQGTETHVVAIPEDMQLAALEPAEPSSDVSHERLPEETVVLALWPAVPPSPPLADTFRATAKRLDPGRTPAPLLPGREPQVDVLEVGVAARERASVRRTVTWPDVLSEGARSAEDWADVEGMWPSLPLPEEPQYGGTGRELERYQRGQRRWDEQRGNL